MHNSNHYEQQLLVPNCYCCKANKAISADATRTISTEAQHRVSRNTRRDLLINCIAAINIVNYCFHLPKGSVYAQYVETRGGCWLNLYQGKSCNTDKILCSQCEIFQESCFCLPITCLIGISYTLTQTNYSKKLLNRFPKQR